MPFKIKTAFISLVAASLLWACTPSEDKSAETWTLVPDQSGMTYITVKNSELAEINTFREISGSVTPDGAATFTIDLGSVDTANETRDGRMKSVLFETGTFPQAIVTTKLDMAAFEALAIGESETVLLDMTIDLHGVKVSQDAYVLATRLGTDKVVVANKAPIILHAEDFGFMDGLAKLQALAGLDAITPVVPVTVSLTFER